MPFRADPRKYMEPKPEIRMPDLITPYLFGLVLLAVATVLGIFPIRKAIQIKEAKHELKQGSAGYLRSLSGWSIILFWAAATWFCATILGDWSASGDLQGALARAQIRLQVLLELLALFGDN